MSRILAVALCTFWVTAALPALAAPKVVVSILPIHSIVSGIMRGVAEPQLLIPAGASPHTYALKPSDARLLQSADLVVWVGEGLENYLERPLNSLAAKTKIVEASDIDGLTRLKTREGGLFESHDRDDHAGERNEAKNDLADGHDHGGYDMHLWLDPENARLIATTVAGELAEADPAHAQTYRANARQFEARIATLNQAIETRLAPIQNRPYIVFHDAYQYFEHRFGTNVAGSITVSPDQAPGAKRLSELRGRLSSTSVVCVFREPQFPAPVVDTLVRGTGVKIGTLDPEGADLKPGADAYFTLMERMAESLAECLKPAS